MGNFYLFVKINFDNASDIIEWGFILDMLDFLGFVPGFRFAVKTLISRVSVKIHVNGRLSSQVISTYQLDTIVLFSFLALFIPTNSLGHLS